MLYILILFAGGFYIMAKRDQTEKVEAAACENTLNGCMGMCYEI